MIPELGEYSLILALCLSALLAVVPLVGATTGNRLWMSYARPLARAQFLFLGVSMACLVQAFLSDDFSVAYVAGNSNTALPYYYKFSAVWGGHEGSLLLWVLILGGWTWAVAAKSEDLPLDIVARVLSVMGMIGVGFILFTLLTSSPFERLLPNAPAEGGDLNPLLQDFGLIVHPPMLYMGYVGFSVAFAFAIAALLSGRLDAAWARWSRPWTVVAWAFLTLGIALGSWWAYYELGWGGWWFWDPVENASFMPWLIGTALVHSLIVTEKRGVFKSWTVLLAIFAFSLSLLGTFLVRSGVLTSVHAFATDPERGYFVLALLGISIGGSLLLYALRAGHVKSESSFSLLSRETMLLINNIVLVVVCLMVLLGTVYPLLMDALGLGKISVGPPYFNSLFIPLMSVMIVFLGLGTVARWKHTRAGQLVEKLWLPALLSLVTGVAVSFLAGESFNVAVALAVMLAAWVFFSQLRDIYAKLRSKSNPVAGLRALSRSYWAMQLAHIGVAVTIVGITMVSVYSDARDLRMAPGDSIGFGPYTFVYDGVREHKGPNYVSDKAQIRVMKDGTEYTRMHPEKRFYNARGNIMTEAAIDPGFTRDLYVAMGESLGDDAWAIRVQYKPYVRWIWLGGLLMTAGGLLAATDPRYRKQARREAQRAKAQSEINAEGTTA
ncbi:cytochrome c-type biogenesis protein CcmF [Marinobacterium nitratireducens]|uniref:Cytochrome c-type biogenesis protein CcmF n=1 Tax=Marinobacterium nitratireducens TaxID=518897 RepID=A0A917ZJU7_9GAMM|nr:heme lyase CcmF/NrfE family subunit [Marinobacterium nitratireducens]GGO85082.1 cytochrome c-type biogenesis protein CcmF [Marinobacterium nitratireducens]